METLIATAFGRYVNVQRGEADQLTALCSVRVPKELLLNHL